MRRHFFHAKIHRCTVTAADVDYEGSITIDEDLLNAAGILPYEQVNVWNVTRGTRLTTYALAAKSGSGVVCINGAAAHLVEPKDVVIVATFCELDESEVSRHKPKVVFVDGQNRIRDAGRQETPGPALATG